MQRFPGFIGPTYVSESVYAAGERSVNLYPEVIESEASAAKNEVVLLSTPGVRKLVQLPDTPNRGMIEVLGRMFAIVGDHLYEFFADGTYLERATVPLTSQFDPVGMTHNGDGGQILLLADGRAGHYYDLATDTYYPDVVQDIDHVAQIDGFFLGLDTQQSILRVSPLFGRHIAVGAFQGMVDPALFPWDATWFERRSAAPDPWLAMLPLRDEIMLIGRDSMEFWFNGGATAGQPFVHARDRFVQAGIIAPNSLARVGVSAAWVGSNPQGSGYVFILDGYEPKRISTHAVELVIERYKDLGPLSDIIGWSYLQKGHQHYILEFPKARRTWVCDLTSGFWHERGTWDANRNDFNAWRARYHAHGFHRNLVGDSESGTIWELSISRYDDLDGTPLYRVRRAPHLTQARQLVYYDVFELDVERGVGELPTGGVDDPTLVDPQVGLRYSDDGGRIFSNTRWTPLGKLGQHRERIRWMRCGASRDRVFEVIMRSAVPYTLLGAFIETRVAAH